MEKTTATAQKSCRKCERSLELEQFGKAAWCADGRRSTCKQCRKMPVPAADIIEKRCTACDKTKPVSEFQRRAAGSGGYCPRCKVCRKAEKAAEYEANRVAILTRNRAAYEANPAKYASSVSAWQKANRDRRREYYNRRRATQLKASVGSVDVTAIPDDVCGICASPIETQLSSPHPMSKSLDHIIPLARGGTHEQSNLQWTHLRCNIRKGARLTE